MDILESEESDIEVLELQGDVENIHAFDGRFNKDLIQLEFGSFVLKGRKVEKEFCVMERSIEDGKCRLNVVKRVKSIYLFDRPPKYKRSTDDIKPGR